MLKTMMSALVLALSFAGASHADEVSIATGGYARFSSGEPMQAVPVDYVRPSYLTDDVSFATGGYARAHSGASVPAADVVYVGASYAADEISFATGGYARIR